MYVLCELYLKLVRPAQNARPILLQENLTKLNNRQLLICSYLYTIIVQNLMTQTELLYIDNVGLIM